MNRILALAVVIAVAGSARAQDDFKSLFNGKDLSGWVNVNCAPNTWFVKDDMIITTGKPTGYLRTDRQYENFVLEFEWFHAPTPKGSVGNSGLFVWGDPIPAMGTGYTRSIEVQVLVNLLYTDKKTGLPTATSHGDLFSIWGAKCKPDRPHPTKAERCLPSENRAKGEYEWNHYKVIGNNGVLKLEVNGKEVSGVSECTPRKGFLALESEGSECRFKNIKIKELPSTNPKPNEICDEDKGFKSLFTGVDFSGWVLGADAKGNWKMGDGVLSSTGQGAAMWSENKYGDTEIVCDFKGNASLFVRGGADNVIQLDGASKAWSRAIVNVKGNRATITINGKMAGSVELKKSADTGTIGLSHRNEAVQFRNLFVRDLSRK